VVDDLISEDSDLHEVTQDQGSSTWTPQSRQYPLHNQEFAAGSWISLVAPDHQLSPYQGHNNFPIINNDMSADAWSPSENNQEDCWASRKSTAMTSQPSYDARYHDIVDNHSTLRPPLMNNDRSRSTQRPSNRSTNSSRSHPYSRAPSYTAGVVVEYGRPQEAMPSGYVDANRDS
jgi:hypothetical protein